jgi:hypothetical protein
MTMVSIPNAIILPRDNSKKLYGIEPTIITRSDVTSNNAWFKLAIQHSAALGERDFKDKDTYRKYFLLSLGLLEFPVIFVGGEPESGKSLFMAWYTYQVTKLFNKTATLDWSPPEPKYYGKFNNFFDKDFQEKIIDEFNRLANMEKETGQEVPQYELEKLVLYNTVFGLDECDSYAHKQTQTNLTKLLGMIMRRRRHTFTCISMVLIDINEFAPVLLKQCTHKVTCYWEGHFPGTCSILIEDARRGGSGTAKWLWLRPENWLHLWRSHNIPAMTHEFDIHFGNKPKKKKEIEEALQYNNEVS